MKPVTGLIFLAAVTFAGSAFAQSADQRADDAFILRSSTRMPEAVVAAIKSYSVEKNWQYLGETKVRNGEIVLVKICFPAVGQLLWPVGLQLSAMLPCGNVGVYRKGDVTEISVLHPRYMRVLYPHPATERASALALPLIEDMLESVTRAAQD